MPGADVKMLTDNLGNPPNSAVLEFARIFGETAVDIIAKSAGLAVQLSGTAQFVPFPRLSADLASFVTFHGDYRGLLVCNFEGPTGLEIAQFVLLRAGLTKAELPTHFASEHSRGAIGELTNQIVGHARTMIQKRYDLSADANIPVVVPMVGMEGIELHAAGWHGARCVRLGLRTPSQKRFHMELALESSAPVALPPLGQAQPQPAGK